MIREELKEIITAVIKRMEESTPIAACVYGDHVVDCGWIWSDEGVTTLYGIAE